MKRIDCIITIMIDGVTHYMSKDIALTSNRDEAIVFNGRNRAKNVLRYLKRLRVQGATITPV